MAVILTRKLIAMAGDRSCVCQWKYNNGLELPKLKLYW